MKNLLRMCLVLLPLISNAQEKFQYVSPMPGSKLNDIQHDVIIREGSLLNASSLRNQLFTIVGSKSGTHTFRTTLCRDSKTILLHPLTAFAYSEQVTISVAKGLQSTEGRYLNGYTFSFNTDREYTAEEKAGFKDAKEILRKQEQDLYPQGDGDGEDTRDFTGMYTITTNINPTPGDIFFDAFSAFFFSNEWTGYHVITPNGDSVYSQPLNDVSDFKMEDNGNFGVRNGDENRFEELDSNFNTVNKIYGANGFPVDFHEMQITPDHHVFIIADDTRIIDMTIYNPNYSTHATVFGTAIQEFDPDWNLIFEWKSFDHIAVNEAQHINLGFSSIDYIHTNAIDVDNDGNILVSHRHLDQITKIDVNTGEFIWRLGGLNNQFTFTNDAEKFTFQHDIRRIANGDITLWDNGNYHVPAHSTAKEYQLDEVNKTATLVWSYGHPGGSQGTSIFWTAGGDVQRLSNGNTFINGGWRSSTSNPSMFEVTPDGTIVWELKLSANHSMTSYRSHKYEWTPCPRPTFKKLNTKDITASSGKLKWEGVTGVFEYHLQYKKHTDATWTEKTIDGTKHTKTISGLQPSTKYDWRIATWCDSTGTKYSGYTDIKKFTTLAVRSSLTTENSGLDVSIFPNPASDQVSIESSLPITQIRIVDLMGRNVITDIPGLQDAGTQADISVKNLIPGNYLVIVSNNEQQQIKKLVIE